MNIIKRFFLVLMLPLLVIYLQGCQKTQTTGPFPPPFAIIIYQAPGQINLLGNQVYRFEARVSHPGGLEAIREVWLQFNMPGSDTAVYRISMLDDGGVEDPSAGDIQANDGIFTRVLYSAITPFKELNTSTLIFVMEAVDFRYNRKISTQDTILLVRSVPPRILAVSAPDTLYAGISAFDFTVSVNDSDGIEDVRWVLMAGIRGNVLYFQDTLRPVTDQPGIFQLTGDSTYAAEKQGVYQLRFRAEDKSGSQSLPVDHTIFIENNAPHVAQTSLPDSLQLPPPGQQYLIRILAHVWDSQGLNDLRKVTFTVTKEGDDEGDPIEMFDDGNKISNGDEEAGDGVFSRIVTLQPFPTSKPGTYIFKFIAEDRVGQFSPAVLDTMVIVR